MRFIKASLNHPIVTVVITLAVVIVGVHALLTMPRMEDPSITIRTGIVIGIYPGANSKQVEQQLAKKLEEHIFKFPEVRKDKTYSTSSAGRVVINVELEDDVVDSDIFWSKLRNEFSSMKSELPEGVMAVVVNSDFGDTVAMLIAVHGEKYGYRELSDYAERIQDALNSLRNVGKTAFYGTQQEQMVISTDSERLSQYEVDPARMAKALHETNVIGSSGNFKTTNERLPMQTSGLFKAEDQIGATVVDVSRHTGAPVYLRDVADIERKYQDPSFLARFDGKPAVLISVEMQKGNNIVQLGEQIAGVFTELKQILPPDLSLDLIADQPSVVKERINDLAHEILLAIASVILVTMVLLPFRVALIATVAIPVTLCATLGIMNTFDIALHQVSIAALIMVLGIVVDDAIVIADNYIELLDQKAPKEDVAWRSAGDVLVPVLTATLTIISSFLPLLIISGSAGEFISALPKTVAIALTVSFIVAIMLTPILCRLFIKKGLHDDPTDGKPQKVTLLDRVQAIYARTITIFMKRKYLAFIGIFAIVAAGLYFKHVPQQFFPSAERNQFVIDVWMPQGTRIEETDRSIRKIEKILAADKLVAHYASFIGESAPRFYYNVNPQQPDPAYGQFIVNTVSEKATLELVYKLRETFKEKVPEAMVIVKELQQGQLLEAPVEVRISGYDTQTLKELGNQVSEIVHSVPYAEFIYTDYFNDSLMLDINMDTDSAARLGIVPSSVSGYLYGGFDGISVSTYIEGERSIPVVIKLDEKFRKNFSDIENYYVTSPVTGVKIPLRSIADIRPEFQTSRIVRRNGVPTITVRSFVKEGYYASALISEISTEISKIDLPAGYKIAYGGEVDNKQETQPAMIAALGISMVCIFFILLIQFKNILEPLVIMTSIPLALPGAMFGLFITGNPFGFTAFMGLISLCGIVVRNSIILVEYIKEKTAEGHSIELAATEAGERRLRPIFLTTMAAAVGVTPMILSGSSLWSPLASVIAVGLVFSMFFTLLVVPVLYVVVMTRAQNHRSILSGVLVLFMVFGSANAYADTLNLPQVIDIAMKNNRNLKIAAAQLSEKESVRTGARSYYFPKLSVDGKYSGVTNNSLIAIKKGSLGNIDGLGGFPEEDITLSQGDDRLFIMNATIAQPITQLFKISKTASAAGADVRVAGAQLEAAENEIAFAARQLYFAVLTAEKQYEMYQAYLEASKAMLFDAEIAFKAGNVLESSVWEAKAGVLNAEQNLIAAETTLNDYRAQLCDLLDFPVDKELKLDQAVPAEIMEKSRDEFIKAALQSSPRIKAAEETLNKAVYAKSAAKGEYIPDISIFARYTYQDGVPFIDRNIGTFGVQAQWDVLDWGKRRGDLGQRHAQFLQASENLRNVRSQVEIELKRGFGRLEQAIVMEQAAEQVYRLNADKERQTNDRLKAGLVNEAVFKQAEAETVKSAANLIMARFNLHLTAAELKKTAGLLKPVEQEQ